MSFGGPLGAIGSVDRCEVLLGTSRHRLLCIHSDVYWDLSAMSARRLWHYVPPGTSMCYPHTDNRDVFSFPAGPAGEAAPASAQSQQAGRIRGRGWRILR